MTWLVLCCVAVCFFQIPSACIFSPPITDDPGTFNPVWWRRSIQYKYLPFEFKAVNPVLHGMVRVAIANYCTTGQNRQFCDGSNPRDQMEYIALLRNHADAFPTGQADIRFTLSSTSEDEEQIRLIFNWNPPSMSQLTTSGSTGTGGVGDFGKGALPNGIPAIELIMFATPHHQKCLQCTLHSSNEVIVYNFCFPAIHGNACLVLGSSWSMLKHLHPISFSFKNPPQANL